MLYTALDPESEKIVDIIPHGVEDDKVMEHFVRLYNEVTGNQVTAFTTIDDAKKHLLDALHDRIFHRQQPSKSQQGPVRPPWLKEDGTPTVVREHMDDEGGEVQATDYNTIRNPDGPVAKARRIFEEMWGHPRKDIIEACAKVGIKRSTASTQYQHFKTAKESEVSVNEKNGMPQLAPGVQVGNVRSESPEQHTESK